MNSSDPIDVLNIKLKDLRNISKGGVQICLAITKKE
jgi:hypothetical protein